MSVVCPSLRSLRHQHRRQWQQCQSARVLSRLQIIEIITLHPKTHLESSGKSLWPPQLIRVIIITIIIISIIIIISGSSNSSFSISIIDINGKIVIFLSSSEPSLCGVKQLNIFQTRRLRIKPLNFVYFGVFSYAVILTSSLLVKS